MSAKAANKPSKELAELIQLENHLPLDFEVGRLPPALSVFEVPSKDLEWEAKTRFALLPPELQAFISESTEPSSAPGVLFDYCEILVENLLWFRNYARYLQNEVNKLEREKRLIVADRHAGRDNERDPKQASIEHGVFDIKTRSLAISAQSYSFAYVLNHPYARLYPVLGPDYVLDFHSSYVMNVLWGIDVRRLRTCEVCEHVFWAYRLNQRWCSKRCSNTHHQRELRSNTFRRRKINEDRRRNYAYNRSRKNT